MPIAQISPLCESIPPHRYGGTERVGHYLTEELMHRDHTDSGVFHRGTGHISRLKWQLWERPGALLSSTERGELGPQVSQLSNDDGTVHLERSMVLTPTSCLQQLTFTSFAQALLQVPITLHFDADFRDIFEVRGYKRPERGRTLHTCTSEGLEAVSSGLDNCDRFTRMRLSNPIKEVTEARIQLSLQLEPTDRGGCAWCSTRPGWERRRLNYS